LALVIFAAYYCSAPERGFSTMRTNFILVTLIVAIGVYVARYADKSINANNPSDNTAAAATSSSSVRTVAPPPVAAQGDSAANKLPEIIRMAPSARSITLRQDNSGHYRTDARVDGVKVDFLVDTGATAVMLSASTAARLGIRPARSEYTAKVMTGNGEIKAAIVLLNKIEVGDIVVRDVRALVHSDEKMQVDLLGMTFLSQVRWTHDRGKLIIEPLSNN
jgi:aspartyl protease family protein